jgi:MFS family permease
VCSPAIAPLPLETPPVHLRPREPERLFTPAFALILATQMSFGFSFSTFFLLPKYLATELHAGPAAIGQVTAAAMVAAVLAVPWIGRAIDRYDRRSLITFGALVSAAAALALIPIREIGPALFALRAFQGVALALVFSAAATLVSDIAPAARLGQALGLFGTASLVTNAIAPAFGEEIAARAGYAPVFVFGAVTALACAALAMFLPKPARAAAPPLSLPTRYDAETFRVFYCICAIGVGFGTMLTFSLPFAIALGARKVSDFFIGYTATAAGVRLVFGGLADRVGRRRIAVAALLIYGCSLFAGAALRPGWLGVLGAVFGIGHGLAYPSLNALVVEGVPSARRGRFMALFNGCFNAGVALSTFALGSLAKHAGYPWAFATAGLAAFSAVWLLGLRSPRPAGSVLSEAQSWRLVKAVEKKPTSS